MTEKKELISKIEAGTRLGIECLEFKSESFAEKKARLLQVNSENIESGQFSWIDEVVLVALGKKPIAVTHFDTVTPDEWDDDVADYCVEQMGVNSFSVMEYPCNMRHPSNYISYVKVNTQKAQVKKYRLSPENQVGSMIWFRQDTRKLALLARHHSRLQVKNKEWIGTHFDIIQGLIYGYSKVNIAKFVMKYRDFTQAQFDKAMVESQQYIDAKCSSYA